MLQVFLNVFKNIQQGVSLWTQNNGSNCERWIFAYKKNKLCLISILYIKNTNEKYFIRIIIKLLHVRFYQCFDSLSSSWILLLMSFWLMHWMSCIGFFIAWVLAGSILWVTWVLLICSSNLNAFLVSDSNVLCKLTCLIFCGFSS